MSDPHERPWSDNPNAPKISPYVYLLEKANLAGYFISAMLYGMLVVLFFKCMAALFNPIHRKGGPIKWGLVSYTVITFFVATAQNTAFIGRVFAAYIDNREFPGSAVMPSPGPVGYQLLIYYSPLEIISNVMFSVNDWLANGLLLYRCYLIYSMNPWVIAFPCLMYLGSLTTGVWIDYLAAKGKLADAKQWRSTLPYYSISLSLNIILTLMIIIRLVLLARNTRTALGRTGAGGLCRAIITMLIESCLLYAVTSLVLIGLFFVGSGAEEIFVPILEEIQVIAPLLIIQRVANKSALTKNTVVSIRLGSLKSKSRWLWKPTGGTPPGVGPVSSADIRGADFVEPGVGDRVEIATDSRRDMV